MKIKQCLFISILLFSLHYAFCMDIQHTQTPLYLPLQEALNNYLKKHSSEILNRYIPLKYIKDELTKEIRRNRIRPTYNELLENEAQKKQYQQCATTLCTLIKDTINSNGSIITTQEYHQKLSFLEDLVPLYTAMNIDFSNALFDSYSNYYITNLLLEFGANPKIKDTKNLTPLLYAVRNYIVLQWDRFFAIKILLSHGAQVDGKIIKKVFNNGYTIGRDKKIPNEIFLLFILYDHQTRLWTFWGIVTITAFYLCFTGGVWIIKNARLLYKI